ncbi:MAG TPA: DUF1800 family protein [Acidobacteriaceae bacterium]|jgi:uncharacterized protein (DUF1800 family)
MRSTNATLRFLAFFTLLAAALLPGTGCGKGVDPDQAAAITSPVTSLRVNETTQFGTITNITGSPLTFYVNGIQGGNSEFGTVSASGLYTAPALVPRPNNVVTITSIARDYPKGKPGSVQITVLNPIPKLDSVSPVPLTEGSTTIFVNGSQFVYGAKIVWNGGPVSTTYVSPTKLAATVSAPTPGVYSLLVRNPDPGSADSPTLSENVGPGIVTLKLTMDPTVRVSDSIGISPTVGGTANTGLTWTVNGVPGGNANVGTITTSANGSAVYHAPAIVPTPSNIVNVVATSVDDPTVSTSQRIGVLNPIPVLTSASPLVLDPATNTTVTFSGSNFIQGAVVLVNGVASPATFVSGNQLTAVLTLPDPGAYDLQVRNPSPGAADSADLIATASGNQPTLAVTPEDASRFLAQATFGATDPSIRFLTKTGYDTWFAQQFAMPQTLHAPRVEDTLIIHNPPCTAGDVTCNAKLFMQNNSNESFVQQTFWHQAIDGNDQLRQRLVYSLTEMMVISSTNPDVGQSPRGMANYYDVLGADAFGNFRQLLEDVTRNPMMGKFLSMLGNDKGDANRDPDENYAREVMQLFTIGLYQLNPDGSQKLDANGQPIPTYSNTDVIGLAKVFTGFSWNNPNDPSDAGFYQCCNYVGPGFGSDILPMRSYRSHHSIAEKDFLGVTISAGSNDPDGDLKIALDTLFNHPNLPPFFSKQLIQHLVTSNPSPAYIGRVSAVFADNGYGVRGDMKAVIRAVLLDPEARDASAAANNVQFGKVREPLIRYTEWARAFSAQSRGGVYNLGSTEDPIWGLGEMSLRSPSVFNWFAPGYVPPGTTIEKAGLLAPEMEMTNVSTVVGYLNYMQSAIGADASNGPDLFATYGQEISLANDPDKLVDRVNLLLMAGRMDSTLRGHIIDAVSSVTIPNSDANAINAALANRVKIAIYLSMAASTYNAQY